MTLGFDQPSLLRTRPSHLVVVVGTGTEVGKTWIASRLIDVARERGLRVAARKPAQSFEPGDDAAGTTDAQILAASTGERPEDVCPRTQWYPIPMAPPMAADALGRGPLTANDLFDSLSWPAATDLVLVETAGGVRSPLAEDADSVDLCTRLGPDRIVVVAAAGLGTINAVRTSVEPLGPWPVVVVLNRFDGADDLHRRNRAWLEERCDLRCVTSPDALADSLGLGPKSPIDGGPTT